MTKVNSPVYSAQPCSYRPTVTDRRVAHVDDSVTDSL